MNYVLNTELVPYHWKLWNTGLFRGRATINKLRLFAVVENRKVSGTSAWRLASARVYRQERAALPMETAERVLALYRNTYFDLSVRHFHEMNESAFMQEMCHDLLRDHDQVAHSCGGPTR